jgi:outer membrane protein W
LNSHFKAEAVLSYGTIQTNGLFQNMGFPSTKILGQTPGKLSMPVTVQYYFLPEKSRVRPYCGAGLQGNILTNTGSPAPFTDGLPTEYYNTQPDTKYITILFTQGVTFEVNTKIEVNQSFHFIPGSTNKVIGIDLGIGYKIP